MTTSKTSSAPQPGPNEAPPSYNLATTSPGHQDRSHLSVPDREEDDLSTDDDEEDHLGRTTGVDEKTRRSMETELMELPKGWVREFDASSQHVYYVDTTKDPPRSIWVHPYEVSEINTFDRERLKKYVQCTYETCKLPTGREFAVNSPQKAVATVFSGTPSLTSDISHFHQPEYLASIPDTERSRLFNESDPQYEQGSHSAHASTSTGSSSHPQKQPEKRSFGRKLKDKMTNSTHEERQAERKRQAEEEMKRHQAYIRRRKAMLEASQNGTYAPTYAAPQTMYVRSGGYGPYGGGFGGYGRPMYGGGYGRPMCGGGYGYGSPYGGRGLGGAGMGAGLLGGVLLGGLLF
ncbi:BQ5605_C007g04812 [Microbotryum silenes-dioicae]|uniref:BQ5605_C007g04812 protein n=1 Tax=Microbotryum silenes-dioicae TaxID=796604 RepID=A0A2X0PAE3_9BASI|nr:BQ5605_C007g04812 [Microbotryum silenes-dioicae]